jgi:hypothetical protein
MCPHSPVQPPDRAPAAAPGRGRWNLIGQTAQLGLLILVIHQFRIESDAFQRLALLIGPGFVIHALLPPRQRLRFFLLLSIAGLVLVLGAGSASGCWRSPTCRSATRCGSGCWPRWAWGWRPCARARRRYRSARRSGRSWVRCSCFG